MGKQFCMIKSRSFFPKSLADRLSISQSNESDSAALLSGIISQALYNIACSICSACNSPMHLE